MGRFFSSILLVLFCLFVANPSFAEPNNSIQSNESIPQDCLNKHISAKLIKSFDIVRAYPTRALNMMKSGIVEAELTVDELGNVIEVIIIRAEPKGYFEEATIKEAMRVKYIPASENCKNVISKEPLKVKYMIW